jgi:hypothetical protein
MLAVPCEENQPDREGSQELASAADPAKDATNGK